VGLGAEGVARIGRGFEPAVGPVQAWDGSGVAEERDFDERLAAIAHELVCGPDMQHTLQRIVELAANLDGEVYASASLVQQRREVQTRRPATSGGYAPTSCSTRRARAPAWMPSGTRTPSRSMT
jgi:hypothetical protein